VSTSLECSILEVLVANRTNHKGLDVGKGEVSNETRTKGLTEVTHSMKIEEGKEVMGNWG
jgi:hypothetical protein